MIILATNANEIIALPSKIKHRADFIGLLEDGGTNVLTVKSRFCDANVTISLGRLTQYILSRSRMVITPD